MTTQARYTDHRRGDCRRHPKVAGRLDDPTATSADLLHQLPGVADVEVLDLMRSSYAGA